MPTPTTLELRDVAIGLEFPEGPVSLADGSLLLVQIKAGLLSRVLPDGTVSTVADLGGGPNSVAIGPDGGAYVCNNGGFRWSEMGDWLLPMDLLTGANEAPGFDGGWIERVDLETGDSTVLYRECDGHRLRGPNDLVFDQRGNLWFTDFGKTGERVQDRGGLYYATPDGSSIVEVAYGMLGPNGVGLSPEGDRVYVAETYTGRLLAWDLEPGGAPPDTTGPTHGGTVVAATDGHLDSLAVEADGTVVVAAITHGLLVVRPDGSHHHVPLPDPMVTNVCFGGEDRRTAYITLSAEGRLVAADWPRAGLALAH
jgi:gluconolactonase